MSAVLKRTIRIKNNAKLSTLYYYYYYYYITCRAGVNLGQQSVIIAGDAHRAIFVDE